ncbi:YIP1 family protein [Desulforhopalus sp. 52FAK]
MSYFTAFGNLVAGQEDIMQPTSQNNTKTYVVINLIILGIFFGLSNYFGALYTTPDLPVEGKFAVITPLIICVAGFFTISAALIGYSLVYWAAAKAFGGQGTIMQSGVLIGLTCIPFWIIAPLTNFLINYNLTGALRLVILFLVAMAAGWLFGLTKKSLVWGMGLTPSKATLAVGAMWVFSMSSVYVFLP